MKKPILYFLLILSFKVAGQDLNNKKVHSPHKASVLSAIFPGAGQVYNKKYWKVPVIYASLATSVYFIIDNQQNYNSFKNAFQIRANGEQDEYVDTYNNSQLITIMDYYERNRDISYIITAAIYLLNIVDASVDAHLLDFDISDKLSIRYSPTIFQSPQGNNTALSLKMNF